MLVLTRKKGERVHIGDDIVVTVIDVRGDGVRIGFDAPRGVSIQRAEVIAAVTEANTEAAAAQTTAEDLVRGLLAARRPDTAQRARPEPAPEPGPSPTPPADAASAGPSSAARVPSSTRPKPPPRRPRP